MKHAKMRLVLAACLFALWIGYLIYLALPTTTSREVLSRAQFLVSTIDVIANVEEQNGQPTADVVIMEIVHWPTGQEQPAKLAKLHITNLPLCRGWSGPGDYILPLVKKGDHYEVVSVPRSPGFDAATRQDYRIYAATPLNRRQLDDIAKPPVAGK